MKLFVWNGKHSAICDTVEEAKEKIVHALKIKLAMKIDRRDEHWQVYDVDEYIEKVCQTFKETMDDNDPFIFDMGPIGGLSGR